MDCTSGCSAFLGERIWNCNVKKKSGNVYMIYSYTRKTKERTLIPPNNVFYEVNDAHPAHTYSVFTSIYLKTLFSINPDWHWKQWKSLNEWTDKSSLNRSRMNCSTLVSLNVSELTSGKVLKLVFLWNSQFIHSFFNFIIFYQAIGLILSPFLSLIQQN